MIATFKDQRTEDIFSHIASKAARKIPVELHRAARRKLALLHAANDLRDLCNPFSNHLEALKGGLKGYHSIRINRQYRVLFKWVQGRAYDVQVTDYH